MGSHIEQVSDSFWSIRGKFKVGGVVNVGTHASLVQRSDGKFVMLDACGMPAEVVAEVNRLTDDGVKLEAIVNLHPFHTVHVEKVHALYPAAYLFGTRRHHDMFPDLPWQADLTESPECAAVFADDIEFSIPAGVDFISAYDTVHFSSVLAYHRESATIHSDDTLMYLKLPGPAKKLMKPQVTFHPTLRRALEQRQGAAEDFRQWARNLAEQWHDAENLCAAHSANLLADKNTGASISDRILRALRKVDSTLRRHERKYG